MDTFGKLSPEGCDLSYEAFYSSNFFLPFAITAEPTYSFSSDLKERIATKPISSNDKYELFVKFSEPLTYVIRVTVIYKQFRAFSMTHNRETFKDFDTGIKQKKEKYRKNLIIFCTTFLPFFSDQ